MRWLACVLLFICAICDANDDLGAYTACRYAYDSTGNRTEKDCDGQKTRYAYNSLEQLTEEQTATGPKTTYRWDGRGNLLEKSTPSATIRYEWSSDNRLLKASDGSTSIRYGYDALGRRISRTREAGGQKQETQWILDTARPYSEIVLERSRQNGGAWQETRYTHTPDGVGQLISEQRQGKTLHVYEDGQGSARLITDESGQIIETLDFDAFGNESNPDPASPTRHRYTGESYDSATGLYHLRARDYDPKTGRFISMDEHPGSQSIPLTLNKYLYGNADPVNHMDPGGDFGLISVSASGFQVSAMRGLSFRGGVSIVMKTMGEIAFEMATGIPVITSPKNLAKSLLSVNKYLKSKFWLHKFKGGSDFEKIMVEMFGLRKNTRCFSGGKGLPKIKKGCFIPDAYVKGGKLIEIKTSFNVLRKNQFQEFIRIAQQNLGIKMSVIFFHKPTPDQMRIMQRWAIEASNGNADDMMFNIIHILD